MPDLARSGVAHGTSETPAAVPVLQVEDIVKTFGGAHALKGVSFSVAPGEVHGLLGKNGSGKSTLVKILAGFHEPDAGGRLRFNGEEVALPLKPGDFRRLGMSFVHQNLGLVPSLTVLENLRFADLTSARTARIDWRAQRAATVDALRRFDVDLDPEDRIDRLSPVERALLAIVRAFEDIRTACEATGRPGLVLLDEPTPFLPKAGVDKLFGLVRSIAAHGSSVVFISHDIDEVMEITDRLTVLRDGEVAGSLSTPDARHEEIVELIVGRRLAHAAPVRQEVANRPVFARIEKLSGGMLRESTIAIGKGEILGVTGLIGSGYAEVPYLAFGARPCASGSLALEGAAAIPVKDMTPKRAIDLGLALLPGDRQNDSGVGSLSIADNMFLPDVDRFFRKGFLSNSRMRHEARALGAAFEVRPNDPDMKLSALSGGNAQKVLIARWMNRHPRLLLLDEPTQGVDVGTRAQIFAALRAAAANGMSVICASSDSEQLAEICDRVLVFSRGAVCREITGAGITKEGIAAACYASLDLGTGRAALSATATPTMRAET